jgi:hypothetical protein
VTYDYSRCDLFPPDLRARDAIRADVARRPLAKALNAAWHTLADGRHGVARVTPPLDADHRRAQEMEELRRTDDLGFTWPDAAAQRAFLRTAADVIVDLDDVLAQLDTALRGAEGRPDDVDLRYLADAIYLAPLFGLQGVALLWTAAVIRQVEFAPNRKIPNAIALALFCFSLIGYPLLAPLMGRQWLAAEIFGLAPDPTALATLALLCLAGGSSRWTLMIVPLIWCVITGLTLWTMDAGDFFIPPAGALIALAIALIGGRRRHLPGA